MGVKFDVAESTNIAVFDGSYSFPPVPLSISPSHPSLFPYLPFPALSHFPLLSPYLLSPSLFLLYPPFLFLSSLFFQSLSVPNRRRNEPIEIKFVLLQRAKFVIDRLWLWVQELSENSEICHICMVIVWLHIIVYADQGEIWLGRDSEE